MLSWRENLKENSINKPKFVEKDLDLFESINKGKEKHLEGSESLPPIIPLTKAHDVAYVRFSVPDLKLCLQYGNFIFQLYYFVFQ